MLKFFNSPGKIFPLIWVLFGSPIIVENLVRAGEADSRQTAEWEKTVKAAEREGSLTIYGNLGYEKIFDEFEKKFPSIKVAYATGRGSSDIVPRLLSEQRAGKYLGDIYLAGVNGMDVIYDAKALNPIKSVLLLPEVVDTSKWWEGEHNYLDPEKQYIIVFNGPFRVDVVYNTKLADPKDFKSYWDLLNPKWVGKIEMFSNISAPHKFFYYHPDLGPKFLSRLFSEMQVTLSGNMTQIVDWLGTGKFALAIAPAQHTEIHKAQVQGLPVGLFKLDQFKEGVNMTSGTGTLGLLKGAPHPNAAKVAINWLLSREGQISFQKHFLNADSFRIDVPKGEIPPEFRRRSGIKYFDADRMEYDPKAIRDLMNKFGKAR
jgi:iron(III) transport system substrate-binding protein